MKPLCIRLGLCIFLSLFSNASSQHLSAQVGIALSDLAAGAATVVWNAPQRDSLAGAWNFRGSGLIGSATTATESLGWTQDEAGNWLPIDGTSVARWNGVRMEASYRQRYRTRDGVLTHWFAGGYAAAGRVKVHMNETTESDLSSGRPVYGAMGLGLAPHEMTLTVGSLGLEFGYAAECARGLQWEVFAAPMFTGVHRAYTQMDQIWDSTEALDLAWVNRMQTEYEAPLRLQALYLMNTGPWLRLGIVVYWKSISSS